MDYFPDRARYCPNLWGAAVLSLFIFKPDFGQISRISTEMPEAASAKVVLIFRHDPEPVAELPVQKAVKALPAVAPASPESFFRTYAPIVQDLYHSYGIPASIQMAQAMLETGYGSSPLAQNANNLFGIKQKGNEDAYLYKNDQYRRYDNPEASFEDHCTFLLKKNPVKNLVAAHEADVQEWVRVLENIGYAEDPDYDEKILSIIGRYDLTRLDQ
jgi:flagellum-specific peptidoglycan hydrolase FlgJ